jgi:tetratricopeptide (TPR) repeat protein
MHLVCPQCHYPIECATIPDSGVLCPGCGSTVQLAGDEPTAGTATRAEHRQLGRFTLLQVLGQGAFGTVYKARDSSLDRVVALKLPRAGNLPPGGPQRDRFLREARSAAQLRHPSIVSVHEVGEHDGQPFLVSDFIDGVTLADLLSAKRPTPAEAARLCADVAEALHFAHERGVVHRDVKPSNVMVGPDGRPLVMDFGMAKRDAGEATMTLEGQVLGTPAYMAPEQARGEAHAVDGRADVYSVGVVLYQLLTGELPFRGTVRMLLHQVLYDEPKPPRKLNDAVPRDLETVCLKAMAKEPARRYQTAGALAEDLRRFLDGRPVLARPLGPVERGRRWALRNKALAAMTVAAVVCLVGGAAAATAFAVRAGQKADEARDALARANEATGQAQAALAEATAAGGREREARLSAEDSGRRAAEQRDLAKARFRLAREAVDQFHTRVSGSAELKARGLEGLRTQLLETAAGFYEKFVREAGDDAEVRAERGRAYARLGALYAQTGHRDRAEASFTQARAVQQRLTEEFSAEPKYRHDLAQTCLEQSRAQSNYFSVGGSTGQGQNWKSDEQKRIRETSELAVTLLRDLAKVYPDDREYRYELIEALSLLGECGWRWTKAWDEALPIAERLAAENPAVPDYQARLALIQNQLGYLNCALHKRYPQARAILEKGVAIVRKLVAEHPNVPEYEEHLAYLLSNVAATYSASGQKEKALEPMGESAALWRKLADGHPSVVTWQVHCISHVAQLAGLYDDTGHKDQLLTAAAELHDRRVRLADEHPDHFGFRVQKTRGHLAYARVLTKAGRDKEAKPYEEQFRAEEEALARESPADPARQAELADAHYRLGLTLEPMDHGQAAAAYERSLAAYEKIAAAGDAATKAGLVDALYTLGTAYQKVDPAKAVAAYERSVALWKETAKDHPVNSEYFDYTGAAYRELAGLYRQLGRPAEALAAAKGRVEFAEGLVKDNPDRADFLRGLGEAHAFLADCCRQAKETTEAATACARALTFLENLAAAGTANRGGLRDTLTRVATAYREADPARSAVAVALGATLVEPATPAAGSAPSALPPGVQRALSLTSLGAAYQAVDMSRAGAAFGRAAEAWEAVVKEHPDDVRFRDMLARSLGSLAMTRVRLNDPTAGAAAGERAVAVREQLARDHPERPQFKVLAADSRAILAVVLAAGGEHARAAAEAEAAAAAAGRSGGILFNAACALARAAAAAARPRHPEADEQAGSAARYADRAMDLLGEAETAGFFKLPANAEQLQKDDDLQSLRDRDDFKKLVARVAPPAKTAGK